jgi:hypothetical protein
VLGEMERQVVAVPGKAEPATPALDLVEMGGVEAAGAADRQADAVGDEGRPQLACSSAARPARSSM